MQGHILQCYSVILRSQVILPSDITSVSTFHVQGKILQCYPVILPLQVILTFGDITAVSVAAVLGIWYNKTIVALVQGVI